jgi:hypothetical protein
MQGAIALALGDKTQYPTILIASTSWWPFPARLAMAFFEAGHRVEAICPAHHPLLKVKSVQHWHRYRSLQPLSGLRSAILRSNAALVVPCDDRAVAHLHSLYAALPVTAPEAEVIRRSLGSPRGFTIAERRSEFISLACEENITAPQMLPVTTAADLRSALEQISLPAVMKADGTWGGLGVVFIHSLEEAERILQKLSRPPNIAIALKRLIIDRDPFHFYPLLRRQRPTINVQRFVDGRPANSAVVCWDGEVLASIHVEVLKSRGHLGNSTIVRVIENVQMSEATKRLASRLNLSGFYGFDFLIEHTTGLPHLIEMNPRTTPLSHLAMGTGRNLVAALSAKLLGHSAPATASVTANEVVAYFPQAWLLEPDPQTLNNVYHDVPWEEPELVRELIKLPWPERGMFAQLVAWIRNKVAGLPKSSNTIC